MLHLYEEILLLALHDEKGTTAFGSTWSWGVAGAFIAELIVRRRIDVVHEGTKRFIEVIDSTPVGEPLLDEALERIASAKRRARLETWVGRLAGTRRLSHRLAERLCHRGVLRKEEKDVLFFFTKQTYPQVNPEPEREVIERLRNAIFAEGDVDSRTIVLLSLTRAARLLETLFDKREVKRRRERIDRLVQADALGKAVKDAIEAAEAAMIVATI